MAIKKVAWLSLSQWQDKRIQQILIENKISILIEHPEQINWNKDNFLGLLFMEARHYVYSMFPFAFLDEPFSHGKDWDRFRVDITYFGGTVGESSPYFMRKAIKEGVSKVVYTSYAQHLMTVPFVHWNIRNPFCNQIPTIKKMIKEFGRERVPAIFLNLELNRGDYESIVNFAKENNLVLGIIRENNPDGDQPIESIIRDLTELSKYL